MKHFLNVLLVSFLFLTGKPALGENIEGRLESVNRQEQSFVVGGVRFFAGPWTFYEGGLEGFADLREGQEVELDFEYRDGRYHAGEIRPRARP